MRGRLALSLAWLATAWLVVVLLLSIANYTRGVDVIALAITLPVQVAVLVLWLAFPRLPLWIIAGHALIMVALGLGLLITAPAGQPAETLFGLELPWLLLGLVPAGVAMLVAAAVRWTPADAVVH
jgi:hypothetical protein